MCTNILNTSIIFIMSLLILLTYASFMFISFGGLYHALHNMDLIDQCDNLWDWMIAQSLFLIILLYNTKINIFNSTDSSYTNLDNHKQNGFNAIGILHFIGYICITVWGFVIKYNISETCKNSYQDTLKHINFYNFFDRYVNYLFGWIIAMSSLIILIGLIIIILSIIERRNFLTRFKELVQRSRNN